MGHKEKNHSKASLFEHFTNWTLHMDKNPHTAVARNADARLEIIKIGPQVVVTPTVIRKNSMN